MSTKHGGVFVDCVVDQICHSITLDGEFVTVSAEKHREWIIDDADQRLKKFLVHPQIKFVGSKDIDFYELRKLWLLNGFHLALAILGATTPLGTSARIGDIIASKEPELAKQIKGVQDELVDALVYKPDSIFKAGELNNYINKTKERFMASPDTCERILRDALLSPERIAQITVDFGSDLGRDKQLSEVFRRHLYQCVFSFFDKVHNRLYEPAFCNIDRGRTEHLGYVLLQLIPFLVKQGELLLLEDS